MKASASYDRGIDVQGATLEKVVDWLDMMNYGVMRVLGVVMHCKVVHAGSAPIRDKMAQ